MKQTFIALALLILSNTLVHAQDKFAAGYYISANSDTVRGFIQYRYNYNNEFKFRSNDKEKGHTMPVNEVIEFGFDGGVVYRQIDFALGDLSQGPVFAQRLVGGEVNAYRYQGRLFVQSPSNGFQVEKKRGNSEDARKTIQKNTGNFNIAFQGCPTAQTEASKMSINTQRLVQLLDDYHACKNKTAIKYPIAEKKRINIGVSVGVAMPSIQFKAINNPFFTYLGNSTFDASPASPSIAIHYVNRGRNPRSIFAFQQNLQFSQASFTGTSNEKWSSGGYDFTEISTTSIKYKRFDYDLGVRAAARSNKINPYLVASMGVSVLSGDAKSNISFQINDDIQKREETPMSPGGFTGTFAFGVAPRVRQTHSAFIEVSFQNSSFGNGSKATVLNTKVGFLF
ncbi:MAG: hypothetical protein ACOYW3_03020 [Bacteroidota bacterium]